MKKYTRLICRIIVGILVLFMMLPASIKVKAEEVEADLIYIEEEGDFTVMFTYEGEKPEITFISPSGKEYSEALSTEAELTAGHGEGWSTYRIISAEAGQWSVRCDKKNNDEVSYSFVDAVDGLCIQSFNIISIEDGKADLSFDVSMGEDERIRYNYTITAIIGDDTSVGNVLAAGSAYTGELKEITVDMKLSSFEGYRLLLEVTATQELEMFDTMMSEEFNHVNPDTPVAMEDFYTYIDMGNNWCELDWDEYDMGWNMEYQLVVVADGDTENPVYTGSSTECTDVFSYPEGTKQLSISLYYRRDGVLSEPVVKTLDLEKGEMLKAVTEEITGNSQLELFYNSLADTTLSVTVNGQSGDYNIKDSGSIYFSMVSGVNTIEASFAGENKITYRVNEEIYFDTTPPVLKIYEDLDGRVFKNDTAAIAGKVENAAKLTINGVEVMVNEDGRFIYNQPLSEGKNVVAVVATSPSGIGINKNMVITRLGDKGVISSDNKFMPLLISLGISAVIVLYALIFMRNKEKERKKADIKRSLITAVVITGILDAVCMGVFIYFYRINNSTEYLDIVKESIKKAADYLTFQKTALTGVFCLTVVLAVLILLLVLLKKLKERKEVRHESVQADGQNEDGRE